MFCIISFNIFICLVVTIIIERKVYNTIAINASRKLSKSDNVKYNEIRYRLNIEFENYTLMSSQVCKSYKFFKTDSE